MTLKKALLFVLVLVAYRRLPAQLCQGSLGDPIIDITFGAGPNPGPMLTTTKNLNYLSFDCPNDGYYAVRNNTSGCFNNTWHTLNTDHTGNANGYFLLVNASIQKSDFYVDTVKGLCPSTTYEFAAWVLNVILPTACSGNPIKPNLTFNLESTSGVVLQSYTTGNISSTTSPVWNQYGFFFTTPSAVSNVVLRISNNSTGGCGNDIAIDDITFRPCGPKLTPSIKGLSGLVKDLCVGDNADVTLQCNVSTGYNNPAYQWQQSIDAGVTWTDLPGETAGSLVRNFSSSSVVGTYLYRLTVGEAANAGIPLCRVASPFLTINVNANPVTSISVNSPVCEGNTINLAATGGSAGAQYTWSGANSFASTGSAVFVPNAQAVNAGKYFVQVKNTTGCQHTDSTNVTVSPAPVITLAFTNKAICQGDSVLLNATGGSSYLWSPPQGLSSVNIANPLANPKDSIIYKVLVENAFSCQDSATVAINVMPKPKANAGPDKAIIEGQSVQLDGSVIGGNASFVWFPGSFINDTHLLKPTVNPIVSTSYVLTAQSNDGCGISSDSTFVRVYKKVVIPNAFSPNGDGVNDTWNIAALNTYDDYELSVFNRYGALVFYTRNYSSPWNGTYNGKVLPVGTYYYLLHLKTSSQKLKGFVVILK